MSNRDKDNIKVVLFDDIYNVLEQKSNLLICSRMYKMIQSLNSKEVQGT